MSISTKLIQAAAGAGGDVVENPWDLSSARADAGPHAGIVSYYTGEVTSEAENINVSSQEPSPYGVTFKSDGTALFVCGYSNDNVHEYYLPEPYNIKGAAYQKTLTIGGGNVYSVRFKPDGTKMYFITTNTDQVVEYDLSTAWDISTGTENQRFSAASQDINPTGLDFKPDGTKMYVGGSVNDSVFEYDLSTAWDISTASYSQSLDVSAYAGAVIGVKFVKDGTILTIVGGADVFSFSLSTPYDISTASLIVDAQPDGGWGSMEGLDFDPSGSIAITCSVNTDLVYSMQLGGVRIVGQQPSVFDLFFKPDGTKMYIIGRSGDDVDEYDLSTAWDTTTATHNQTFSVTSQEGSPTSLWFKPDGTKMYVIGVAADKVFEYDLSTAWDISTASYSNNNLSTSGQNTAMEGIYFKEDGTQFWLVGSGTSPIAHSVFQYDLSTAWDITTASYSTNFLLVNTPSLGDVNRPRSLFMQDNGEKLYVLDLQKGVHEYTLSTPYDITTATLNHTFGLGMAKADDMAGLFWKPDGGKFYVCNYALENVLEYTTASYD